MVSPSLSYIAIVWGVRDYCWLEGFDTWIYLMTLFTTLSYTSALKLHPDLPWNNSSYSASEYAFHVCLQSHPALPSAPYITHTHIPPPPLPLSSLYPSCVLQMELTKERTNEVKVFWNPWNTDELGGIWKQNQTLEIKETSKLLS